MKQQKVWPYFLIALFAALFNIFPLLFFAPFFAILYRRVPLIRALWVSAGCGLLLDIFSLSPFGIQTLTCSLVTLFLFRFRIYFVEKPIGLSSYTVLISLAITLISRFFHLFYDPSFPITLMGSVTDFIVFPLIDGIYAFLFFSLPLIVYRFLKAQYFRFLLLREESKKRKEECVNAK